MGAVLAVGRKVKKKKMRVNQVVSLPNSDLYRTPPYSEETSPQEFDDYHQRGVSVTRTIFEIDL